MSLYRWMLLLLVLLIAAGCAPAAPANTSDAALPRLVSPRDAEQLLSSDENAVLLDVRTQQEWVTDGHAPDATLIPLDELQARAGELEQDATILVICRSGNRSQTAADMLRQMGYTRVTEVEGGMRNWASAGLEVVYE